MRHEVVKNDQVQQSLALFPDCIINNSVQSQLPMYRVFVGVQSICCVLYKRLGRLQCITKGSHKFSVKLLIFYTTVEQKDSNCFSSAHQEAVHPGNWTNVLS